MGTHGFYSPFDSARPQLLIPRRMAAAGAFLSAPNRSHRHWKIEARAHCPRSETTDFWINSGDLRRLAAAGKNRLHQWGMGSAVPKQHRTRQRPDSHPSVELPLKHTFQI